MIFEVLKKHTVQYVSYSTDVLGEPVDICIGADEETLHEIAKENNYGIFDIRELDEYDRFNYNGAKFVAFFGKLRRFSIVEFCNVVYK